MADKAAPHLLSIPHELRNRIYNEVLVSDNAIVISKRARTPYYQPALLRTCRQIRSEAISLFYSLNQFPATLESYDGCTLIPFYQMLLRYRAETADDNYSIYIDAERDQIHVPDLDAWLKAYHADPVSVPRLTNSFAPYPTPIKWAKEAFRIVEQSGDSQWAEVHMTLLDGPYRPILQNLFLRRTRMLMWDDG